MILWEAVIEEIALEGLDGITLPSLWLRLQCRPDIEFVFDDAEKQWIWNYIRQRAGVLSFYEHAEPRPSLSLNDDDTSIDDKGVYPVSVVYSGDIWGSCATIEDRVDITEVISIGDGYSPLKQVLDDFDERLVIVASQAERIKVLLGPSVDFGALFRDSEPGRQQFAMLERIGRSRYQGISAAAQESLHAIFNMRAKDVFYVLKRFENFGIIRKKTVMQSANVKKSMKSNVVVLSRYSTPIFKNKYFAQMQTLVSFLEKKEDKKASFNEVKQLFGVDTVHSLRKMIRAYPGVIGTSATREDAPLDMAKRMLRRGYRRKKKKGADSVEPSGETSTAANDENGESKEEAQEISETPEEIPYPQILVRYYHLVGKLESDEETGENLSNTVESNLDESMTSVDDVGEEETEAMLKAEAMNWPCYNPYRSRIFECLRIIREEGARGLDCSAIRNDIGVGRKQLERLLLTLKGADRVKTIIENDGKYRRIKYVSPKAEHEAEQYLNRFEEITGIRRDQLIEKEKALMGDRTIRRMLFILEYLEEKAVSNISEMLKGVREIERMEGYSHEMDRKRVDASVKFLTKHGQLKTFITLMMEGPLQRTVEFVCRKDITLSSPELQSKMSAVREEMIRVLPKSELPRPGGRPRKTIVEKLSNPFSMRGLVLEKKKIGRPKKDKEKKKKEEEQEEFSLENGDVIPKAAWRRTHPAVAHQFMMKRRKEGESIEGLPRKKPRVDNMDEIDQASMARRRKLRAQFSQRERQMLLLMRAVSYIFYAGSRLWVDAVVIRDLMHRYLPESLDKTAKALVQVSARDLGTSPQIGETMLVMAEQLKKHKAIKKIKKRLASMDITSEVKRSAFAKAVEIAKTMFFSSDDEIDLDDVDLTTLYETHDVSVDLGLKSLWPINDINTENDVLENTTKRAFYSACSLSRRDGSFGGQLKKIYASVPQHVLLGVLTTIRQHGMIAKRKPQYRPPEKPLPLGPDGRKRRRKRVPVPDEKQDVGNLGLSFFYRHFFYHHFHVPLPKESLKLLDLMVSHCEEWHNVLQEVPGYAATLIALSWKKQVYFDMTVPSNVVNYNENDDNQMGARVDAEMDGEEDEEDDPMIVYSSVNTTYPHDDDMDNDSNFEFSIPSTSTDIFQLVQQQQQQQAIVVKTEPATESVRLSCATVNKWLLYKLRQERLHACEATDNRSMNLRIRDLTLNSCTLTAKLAPNYEDTRAMDFAVVREGMSKLVDRMIVKERQDDVEEGILRVLRDRGALGMTVEEVQEFDKDGTFRGELEEAVQRGAVYICGVVKERYVHAAHIEPWAITSYRVRKDAQARTEQTPTDVPTEESRKEPVTFLPRPWLKPDGTLNKSMLRWLCEGILLRVITMPGITVGQLREQFTAVLDIQETNEIAQFLIGIGCLSHMEKECCQRKPRLFGPPIVEKLRVSSYYAPIDALLKFSAVFDQTPMPDFVTSSQVAANPRSRMTSVFGRRRLPVTPYSASKEKSTK